MKMNSVERRSLKRVVFVLLAVLAGVAEAQAAGEWKPSKPIEFVAPYAPGGGSDVLARSIVSVIDGEKLSPVPLMVVNRPGGSGLVGTTGVAQQRGNPYTLLTFISGQASAPLVTGGGSATFRDLTMIALLAIDEQLIVVKTDSPFKKIEDVVAAAKQRTLTIGGTATGQEDHMCNRLFEKAADIKFRYVPFNSGGECITAVLGGHVDMIWANPSEFVPQWEAKMVRPIAVAKEVRLSELPDVPTFKEKGFNVTFKMFRGISAAPGIPPEAATFYEKMMNRVSDSPRWKEGYLKRYMLSPSWMGSKDFNKFVGESEELFKGILKELGLVK
jgi:putative tricarboxylic transport membrane protein